MLPKQSRAWPKGYPKRLIRLAGQLKLRHLAVMAIFIDAPTDWGHRFGPSSHLISDIAGVEGTFELIAFADQIGMMAAWLQYRGTEKEHFDLFGPRIDWAVSYGAELVHRRKIVIIIREKRSFYASLNV